MPANRSWGLIRSGETFEALVTALVFFDEPKAKLLGRPGRDGGKDVASQDGTLVHQAKFHEKPTAAKAISDAKKELAKIEEYRAVGHALEPRWREVLSWRLWTNASFSDADQDQWREKIVPGFAALGLNAELYEKENINGLLDRHPSVDQSYFGGEPRAFRSLAEVRRDLLDWEPILARGLGAKLRGRERELKAVVDFSKSNKRFLLLDGSGGVGKSRLALEAGEKLSTDHGWQVLWANVETMERGSAWFGAIIPEKPTLLIVDEPKTENLLGILTEQMRGHGRVGAWKVIVTTRTPKDPVVRYFNGREASNLTERLSLDPLEDTASTELADELLASSTISFPDDPSRQELATNLTKWFEGIPVWISLAVDLIEAKNNLQDIPETTRDLASEYLREVTGRSEDFSADVVGVVLRWVSLYGKLSVENEQTLAAMADEAGLGPQTIKQVFADLVRRRAVVERGARNRLREIAPDVLRDHVLLEWLTFSTGAGVDASDEAARLTSQVLAAVRDASLDPISRAILTGLARAELILRTSFDTTAVLDGLFGGLENDLPSLAACSRQVLAYVLNEVAYARPRKTLELCRMLRSERIDPETSCGVFGDQTVTYEDVLLELASVVRTAAMVVDEADDREVVLEEFLHLVEAEAEAKARLARGLPNDGLRAAQLLGEVIQGGPRYRTDFSDAVEAIGMRLLAELSSSCPSDARLHAAKALLDSGLSYERTHAFERGESLVIQRFELHPEHPASPVRARLLGRLKEVIESGSPSTEALATCWDVFADAHHSANRLRDFGKRTDVNEPSEPVVDDRPLTEVETGLLANLEWAEGVLQREDVDFAALGAARELWDWHRRFEQKPRLKDAALRLEGMYGGTQLAAEFEPLASEDPDAQECAARDAAQALAASEDEHAIEGFLVRADRFFGDSWRREGLRVVALELGKLASKRARARDFVRRSLSRDSTPSDTEFARLVALRWITSLRKDAADEVLPLVKELEGLGPSEDARATFLNSIYARVPFPANEPPPGAAEMDYIRSRSQMYVQLGRIPEFVRAVAERLDYEWPGLSSVIEEVLAGAEEQIPAAVSALVDAVYWALRRNVDPPPQLGQWLLDQVVRQDDLDAAGGRIDWHLREVLKRVGGPDIIWFARAVEARLAGEATKGVSSFRGLGTGERLSSYVSPISEADASDPKVRAAATRLVRLALEDGNVGYGLTAHLVDIDPHGEVVPDVVLNEFGKTADTETRRRLARVAGAFALGSEPWRRMARPILLQAAQAAVRDRDALFFALTNRSARFRRAFGAVSEAYLGAVKRAKDQLDEERDDAFLDLWTWRLERAEARLREQEETAKEERGE